MTTTMNRFLGVRDKGSGLLLIIDMCTKRLQMPPNPGRQIMGARSLLILWPTHYSSADDKCKVMALIATMMVLKDITTAPTMGSSMKPSGAKTPAAKGIATRL